MLLTLDLATKIGWTCGDPDDRAFSYGHFTLPRTDDLALWLEGHINWLRTALDGVSVCAFESPVLWKTSLATARKLYSQSAVTELLCHQRGIKRVPVNNQTVKQFMGSGAYKKADMIAAVGRFGFDVDTDDEADAVALRLYVLHRLFPKEAKPFNLDLGPLGASVA